jgi:catechol 2,3-dioxygenase-like lactoylglutathione lyase family enzyme
MSYGFSELRLTRIRQVKIPVSDLRRSVAWYRKALDLDLAGEFVEQGVLRGAVLADRQSGFVVAPRDRAACVTPLDLAGFDVVAFEVESRQALLDVVVRWDELGVDHTDVLDAGPLGLGVDALDPDGTHLRFLCDNPFGRGDFIGVAFDGAGEPSIYDRPRLDM